MEGFTGIGSRAIPESYGRALADMCAWVSQTSGLELWSGHANGSDTWCEEGIDRVNGAKKIFLPWKNFNESDSVYVVKDDRAYDIAAIYHPCFRSLSRGAKALMARNSHQVLGWNLEERSKFVLCYTPNGSGSGGTGQAIRIANDYGIPVIDAGRYADSLLFVECAKDKINQIMKGSL